MKKKYSFFLSAILIISVSAFAQGPWTLTVNYGPGGYASGGGTYNNGDFAYINAMADPGYAFAGWSGDVNSSSQFEIVYMNGNKTVTANFTVLSTWTLTVNSSSGGSATGGGTYSDGSNASIQANRNSGYVFTFWSGAITSSSASESVTMNADKTVTASFSAVGNLFKNNVDYTVGSAPIYLTTADFNGDNKLDLAIVNQNSNTVSILLGNGDGTFQSKVDYTTGSNPISVTAGDFNKDNKVDIAVANYDDNTISIFLGVGDGTFNNKVDYSTGSGVYDLITGDFNGDNNPDIATANSNSNSTSILLGNGDGTFQNEVEYTTGSGPRSITTGDFNGDSKLDLAVGSYGSSKISILLGNGNGTFQNNVDYSTGSGNYSPKAADFNGDNKLDLAVVNVWDNTVSILIGNGDGTFQSKVDYISGGFPYRLTIADFNGDNKTDIAVADGNNDATSILLGNGDGTFQTRSDYPTGSSPYSITSGDFNGDNISDIAVGNRGNNSVSVLINNTILAPSTQASEIVFSNTQNTQATISWTNGNGSNRAVFVYQGNSGAASPSDNMTYTANTAYGSGTQISSTGWYCVYNGTGTSVTVTNLTSGTDYRVMVVEYNGSSGSELYNSSSATNNPNDFTSLFYSGGSGTTGDPYLISNAVDLKYLSEHSGEWSKYFKQTANITFDGADFQSGGDFYNSGAGFIPIGNSSTSFTGSYDGNGYTIDGLYISRGSADYVGLFGYISSGAAVKNIGVINANITGQYYVGGLVGYNLATVSNSYSTGSVSGSSYVGGLVGQNDNSSTVSNSYNTGSVSGTNVGGLVGINQNYSTVTNSYSTGSVSGTYVGGLVGYNNNHSTVSNCYSTGSVSGSSFLGGLVGIKQNFSTVTNSFWDTQTSGQSSSDGGTGKTTNEMKTASTFTGAGWDFIVETTNGTNDYWEMNSGLNNGYPILSWQSVEVSGITNTPNIVSKSNIGFTAESGSISLGFVEMNATPQNLPGGSVTINKYWEISDITGGNVKLRLYYLPSLTASFTGTPKIFHYNGSSWEELPTDPEVTDGNLRYVETTNYYSSFSPVTVWDNASALPVEMAAFSAKTVNDKVNLTWQTATEVNNHGFEVQRAPVISNEMRNLSWEKVGFVEGAGNSNSPKSYSFEDQPTGGTRFSYRIKQIDNDGKYKYYDAITVNLTTNQKAELLGNYPNPFNPSTSIKFYIPNNSDVTIKIFDMLGREVTTLINKQTEAGYHVVYWNGNDQYGKSVASGVYIYRLTAGSFVQIKKMALMK